MPERFHWPERIYERRSLWHWLADAGAPDWLWSRFVRCTWRPCAVCGIRGIGHWKPAASFGGGRPARHYCSHKHYYAREDF